MSEIQKPYIASKAMTDALKQEVSVLKPEQERYFIAGITELTQHIIEHYADFIPFSTQNQMGDLGNRTVITSQSTVDVACMAWNPEQEQTTFQKGLKPRGFFNPLGNIIFLTHPRYFGYQYWRTLHESAKQKWNNAYGTEQKAKREYGALLFSNHALHEILHSVEESGHIAAFSEGAATYYQKELCKDPQLFKYVPFNGLYEYFGRAYEFFVNEYGDTMHNIFFGYPMDNDVKLTILAQHRNFLIEAQRRHNE
ncbi:hypothetical protein HY468_03965 [Candidatus Roizmanbacteria bacterium]|nr:hypothetical protein [Candidatus Roizmanbacteria bacterium]